MVDSFRVDIFSNSNWVLCFYFEGCQSTLFQIRPITTSYSHPRQPQSTVVLVAYLHTKKQIFWKLSSTITYKSSENHDLLFRSFSSRENWRKVSWISWSLSNSRNFTIYEKFKKKLFSEDSFEISRLISRSLSHKKTSILRYVDWLN